MKPAVLPTLEEINAAYEQGKLAVRALFERQTGLIRDLEAQIQKLEDQIAKSPSSDGLEKRVPKSRREPNGKPSGGQVGHVGHRLEPVDTLQHVKRHPVAECGHCHANSTEVEATKVEKRPVPSR